MYEMDKRTDEELVEEIRSRDKELYYLLVKRYENKLLKYAIYLIGEEDKALDALQESFIKVYKNLNSFNTKKKFSSWIYRIVHNQSINIAKKYKKERKINEEIEELGKDNLEEELSKKEIIQKARDCINEMPILYKEPLALYYLEDKSYEEISEILRIPMGTVATRIKRAKIIMKKLCQRKK